MILMIYFIPILFMAFFGTRNKFAAKTNKVVHLIFYKPVNYLTIPKGTQFISERLELGMNIEI